MKSLNKHSGLSKESYATYRALACCQTGGELALDLALQHRDIFGSLGIFSVLPEFDAGQAIIDSIKSTELDIFCLGSGNTDPSFSSTSIFHELLSTNDVPHTWDIQYGSYNWLAWRKSLLNMIQLLFK